MPLTRPFAQIDVFSAVPCAGNPVAVVLDGQGLDAALTEVRAFAAPIGVPEDPVTG
ncbi:MAG TPA: phenazine biosynthesis protein PhzF, partial [Ottowia sp.]|nr:phenazine biosynthesis protein PhzF [Ottowia sp.]